jgi:hypothetical protein
LCSLLVLPFAGCSLSCSPRRGRLQLTCCAAWERYSLPKCKYLLTFASRVWPFVLFKKFMKILFILLWYVLSSSIF